MQELNAIEKRMGSEQRAIELASHPSAPLSARSHTHHEPLAASRKAQERERRALKLAEVQALPAAFLCCCAAAAHSYAYAADIYIYIYIFI